MSTRIDFRQRTLIDQPAVDRFNRRMQDGGSDSRLGDEPYRFYGANNADVQVTDYVCASRDEVHGGVALKTLDFHVAGRDEVVAFYKYPVTEALVDRSFSLLPVVQQKEVLKRYPLTYGLGVGSRTAPVAQLMTRTGWELLETHFMFKVLDLRAFLVNARVLPTHKTLVRFAVDVLLALHLDVLFALWRRWTDRATTPSTVRTEHIDAWPEDVDELWESAKRCYAFVGKRTRSVLDVLFPREQKVFRKIVVRDRATLGLVGYAVYTATKLHDHKHFGNMRLGALVDVFAAPEDASRVLRAALAQVYANGVDLVVMNQMDRRWLEAARTCGMRSGPTNFFLFLAPRLKKRFADVRAASKRFFITRADGDGPIHLF
jgi:hypothetical protein